MEKDAYYYYMVANEQFKNGQIEEAIKIFLKSIEMEYHFKTYEKPFLLNRSLLRTEVSHRPSRLSNSLF